MRRTDLCQGGVPVPGLQQLLVVEASQLAKAGAGRPLGGQILLAEPGSQQDQPGEWRVPPAGEAWRGSTAPSSCTSTLTDELISGPDQIEGPHLPPACQG